jgi:hypothetical protein
MPVDGVYDELPEFEEQPRKAALIPLKMTAIVVNALPRDMSMPPVL